MNKKNYIFIGVIIVILLIGAVLIGIVINKEKNKDKVVANGIVLKKEDKEYEGQLVKNYDEYYDLLKSYNVSDVILLTNNDFTDYDYIVDYLEYEEGLEITDINITDDIDGLIIEYYANKEVKNSDKYLMYFIPVEKGTFDEITIKSRSFSLK